MHNMKKIIFAALAAFAIFSACKMEEIQAEFIPENNLVYAMIQNEESTKTVMDQNRNVRWSEGDLINLFDGTTLGLKYQIQDEYAGKTFGYFFQVQEQSSGIYGAGMEIDHTVAYYPYDKDVVLEKTGNGYNLNVTIPSVQTYASGSFGNNVFPMTAVSENNNLTFRNVCGGLKLQLTGTDKIASIKVEGRSGEILSGDAVVTVSTDTSVPTISINESGSTSVVLDCKDGVQLYESVPTDFIIILPPTIFSDGFIVTVYDVEGKEQILETKNENRVIRSSLLLMPPVSVETMMPQVPQNEIWYTTNDGKAVNPTYNSDFNATIESNVYADGKGIITFSSPLTTLAYQAFRECQNLTSIILPEGLTKILYYSFEDCKNLKEVIIPATLSSVNGYAFYKCPALERFNGVHTSEDGRCIVLPSWSGNRLAAFAPNGITTYTLQDNIVAINEYVFSGNTEIRHLIMPNSITSIGGDAFSGCIGMESIVLSENLTYIDMYAFSGCSNLKKVENATNIRDLGYLAFSRCTSLESIDLPSLEYISENPFYGCTSLREVNSPLTSEDGRSIINRNGEMVSFIPAGITDYIIPDGVTSLTYGTFGECGELVSLQMSDSVIDIANSAFQECTALQSVRLSGNLESIGSYAFNGCVNLKNIILPSSLKAIRGNAFQSCDNLEYIICNAVTPPDLSDLDWAESSGLDGLSEERVKIFVPSVSLDEYKVAEHWSRFSEMIYAIEDVCIYYTTTDGNIVLPYKDYAFGDVEILSNTYSQDGGMMVFNNPVTTISSNAFYNSQNLLSIIIPDAVTNMEYDSISQCEYLESIKFGNGLTVVKGVDNCRNLKEIIFSQNNVEIDSYAFRYNDALTELQIPDHIHTIREWAFQECDNLKSVNLGAGMKLIDDSVFLECINLESVYISAVVPPDVEYSYWGYWDVFYGCHENLLIYVPEESLNAYQTAEGWCEYADRIVGYAF